MKLNCLLVRSDLERAAVNPDTPRPPSKVSHHLITCGACAAYYQDLRSLSGELSEAFTTPAASLGFTDAVWRRIERAEPVTVKPRPLPVMAAVAVAAVIALVIWTRAYTTGGPPPVPVNPLGVFAPQHVAEHDKTGSHAVRTTPAVVNKVVRHEVIRKNDPAPIFRRHHRIRRHRPRIVLPKAVRQLAKNDVPSKTVKQPLRPQWASWGAWWEARGDYLQASAAYGRAYEERNDPSLAFAAGRSAECAGNVAQAVEYYTQLLSKKPEASKQPEKGSYRWLQDHDSV